MVKYKGMKIIIISQVCYPRLTPRSHRATELAKELVRQGHKVTLYAFLGNYDYSQISESTGILFKSLGNAKYGMPSNTKGQGQKIWHRLGRIIGRPIIFPECVMIPMVKNAIKSEGEIDLLITIAVPHVIHFATSLADRSKVKNWIADCGDPFMGNPMYKLPFYFEWFERRWCKRCNYITVPVEDAINAYYSEYHDKIRVIPQGFDFENNNLAPYKKNRVPTFAYSGIFYKDLRDPSGMLDYLCTMDRDFKFVVYTKGIGLLQPYMERLKGKLEVRNYVPREELLFELSKMDFLLNVLNKSGVQQPSKLIDYALTKRPILNVSSEFNKEEQRNLDEFLQADYQHQYIVKDIEQYNIVNVAQRFLGLTK